MTQLCLQPCTALTALTALTENCMVLVVSLQDEQAMYASTEGLSVHYAQSSMNPEVRGHMTVM